MESPITDNLKKFFTNSFSGAVGALITLLIISHWNQMAKNSKEAKEEVVTLREEIGNMKKTFEAQVRVLIEEQARLESFHDEPLIPLIVEESSLDKFQQKKEMIQEQIKREVKRGEY